jgi:hypothetical protein
MKKIIILMTTFFLLAVSAFAAETTLLKRTIQITPKRFLRYWKDPKAAEPVYDTYSWAPQISFDVLGPIEGGSKIYVEFDTPDGKPWMKVQMRTPELGDDIWETIKSESVDDSALEKQAITSEGVFPFRIKMKNALNGTDKVMFSGKFKVGTYLLDQKIPDYKGKKDFFVDYDWHLPIAYVWLNPQSDENVPQLAASVCLRGAVDSAKLEAYLFYNGKQISKKPASSYSLMRTMTSAADEPSHRWTIWEFTFDNVRGFNKSESANDWSSQFFMDKNPGECEIKILRDNQLSRVIKFTVGKDGKIVDNGVAKQANLGGVRMIFSAKISGTADGQISANMWSTDALFGNPLTGFSIQ